MEEVALSDNWEKCRGQVEKCRTSEEMGKSEKWKKRHISKLLTDVILDFYVLFNTGVCAL